MSTDKRRQRREAWLERCNAIQPGRKFRELAIFIGSLDPPEVAAAQQIIDFAPRLPHVLFLMVGSHGDAFRMITVPRNVVFIGVLPERLKARLMSAASVGLNPLESESDGKQTLVEYFAHGVPAVSTALGTRGLLTVDRVHLLVAPIAGFVTAIQDVLANPQHAAERAAAARHLVESRAETVGSAIVAGTP